MNFKLILYKCLQNNCKNYIKFERIGTGSFANIYKAKKKLKVMLKLKKLIKQDI